VLQVNAVDELEIPLTVNLVAVAVGAVVGTLRAGEERDIDIVGMFALALCFGFGGGIVRDILLGNLPPAAFRTPAYVITVLVAAVVGSIFLVYLDKLERPLWVFDSLSIGLFAAVGANAALLKGLGLLPSVLVGTVASVGGVILADLLRARPSPLLRTGPPLALAGLGGAVAYTALYNVLDDVVVTTIAVAVTFAIRLSGPLFDVRAPMPRREPLRLRTRVRQLWAQVGARPRDAD
jgi:uncharacterized membrane protein YeiH